MDTAFVSGHTDLSKYEFEIYYIPKLEEAIAKKHNFIVGSALGADRLALEFLVSHKAHVTAYIFEKNPDYYMGALNFCMQHKVDIITGFTSYNARDKQMTENSTYDIAWVRSIDESKLRYGEKFDVTRVSGTQRNIDRRAKQSK